MRSSGGVLRQTDALRFTRCGMNVAVRVGGRSVERRMRSEVVENTMVIE